MNYRVDHIPKTTPNERRPGLSMVPEYLTIHSTGNPKSTAANERAWLTNPSNSRTASFHIAVDDTEAVECLPLNEVAWNAGDGNGNGNMKSISIEICESGNRTKTIDNAVELVARMLKERGWGVDRLRRHMDWSGKNCPRIMTSADWEGFKSRVKDRLTPPAPQSKPVVVPGWKRQDHDELIACGLLTDDHSDSLDESVPKWMLFSMINRIRKEKSLSS
ncbi:peptidoglycan recognition protein family protein [Brevibacillus brevis]|uniref:peptidoglycan recognition protein family protein n=1 Tax=Brevibacillus brevis TaxID=1393 RepID=UPI0019026D94|nr:N-acetylmuramoyl-L-alanine amidase [Brevibacillus brevis]